MSEALKYSITRSGFREAESPSIVTALEHWILIRAVDKDVSIMDVIRKSRSRFVRSQFDPMDIVDSVQRLVDLGMLKEVL